jgi:glycosyltransferase involved in cell wall biosynthesis
MKKKLYFLLPSKCTKPVGGYKVVYEYANRLSEDNYDVTIIYPALLDTEHLGLLKKIKRFLIYCKVWLTKDYSCRVWFSLSRLVKELWVYQFTEKYFKENDIVFATSVETAIFLMNAGRLKTTKLFYLIQNYEIWLGDEELLLSTWKANFKKIVISPWLKDIALKHDQDALLIENGFDFDYFNLTNPIEDRSPYTVAMLYHTSQYKGCKYAFEALSLLKEGLPQLKCLIFGVYDRPDFLPEWYEYYKEPGREAHNKIYNEASIFIAPALMEGFGLTLAEAMQCGCAVAATDIGGYAAVCKNLDTALVCPPENSRALADALLTLINNRDLRISIAKRGNEYIKQFTWQRAYSKLKEYIEEQ